MPPRTNAAPPTRFAPVACLVACALAALLCAGALRPAPAFAAPAPDSSLTAGAVQSFAPSSAKATAANKAKKATKAKAAAKAKRQKTQPIYQLFNPQSGEHFFTASKHEHSVLIKAGWLDEGVGWMAPVRSKTPVYRLSNRRTADHRFTTSRSARDQLRRAGWRYEGIAWYSDDSKTLPVYKNRNGAAKISPYRFTLHKKTYRARAQKGWERKGVAWYAAAKPKSPGRTYVYSLFNMDRTERIYTKSVHEATVLQRHDWIYEGVAWVAPSTSKTPVYRLSHKRTADHYWTTSASLRKRLIKKGWTDEGIGWYSDDKKRVGVYHARNAHLRKGTSAFTTKAADYRSLGRAGWQCKGTAFWAQSKGVAVAPRYKKTHVRKLLACAGTSSGVTASWGTISSVKRDALQRSLAGPTPVNFIAINTKTGKVVSRNADKQLYGASTIKAPYLAALCKYDAPGIGGWRGSMHNICTWSSNEDYAAIRLRYGASYLNRLCNESQVSLGGKTRGDYAMFTPRDLAKLWLTIDYYVKSGASNRGLFTGSFGQGALYKEGWMWGSQFGTIYHIAGIEGDVVYAVMTGYSRPSSQLWQIRRAAINAVK